MIIIDSSPTVGSSFTITTEAHLEPLLGQPCRVSRAIERSTKLLARGLEPPRVSPYGPEPYASANSATRAKAGHTMRVRRMTCKVKSSRLEWENSEQRWLNQPERFLRARTSNWCALRT